MRKILFLSCAIWGMTAASFAQSFSINTDGSTADTSAMLDVKSTTKGMLLPRMTKTQRNLIFSPAEGLLVFQTGPDSTGLYYYRNGWKWLSDNLKTDTTYWKLAGNTNITAPSILSLAPIDGSFIGTTDAKDFVIGVNNLERMRFKANNTFVGFGSTDPQYALDLTMNFDAVTNCSSRNGLRLKLPSAINAACDAGYFMGYPNAFNPSPNGNDILFWNFDGSPGNNNRSFRWGFGTDTMTGLGMKLLDYRLGIAQTSPLFALDMRLNPDATTYCERNGLRMTLPALSSGCDVGYFMGYPNPVTGTPNGNDIMFWNFDGSVGSNNNMFRWGFGTDTMTGLGMKLVGPRLGIAQTSPLFALDIKTNPDATAPCLMNGIRMTHPAQNQGCNSGIFLGFEPMDSPNGATIWNFGNNGSNQNYLRFGTDGNINAETMRIINRKIGINITDPQATLHITDATAALNGLRVTHPVFTTTGSYFFGSSTGSPYELEISSEFADPIRFYTNKQISPPPGLTIHNNGNTMVGANTAAPHSTLQVDGTVAVAVSNGIAGGGAGSPVALNTLGSYISLNPGAGTDNYQLPDAATCAGRIYYIRNTSASISATLVSAGGNLCPGSASACGGSYSLPFDAAGKTVIAISDGANWTIGQIN